MSDVSYDPRGPHFAPAPPQDDPVLDRPAAPHDPAHRRFAGDAALWCFLAADLLIFVVFFLGFIADRNADPAGFADARHTVGLTIGIINTIILLTSSLFVVIGVNALRRNARAVGQRMFRLAIACGLAFVVLKFSEYYHLISHGHGANSHLYFTHYFYLTGLHMLHVFIGIAVLVQMARRAGDAGIVSERQMRFFDSGACWWHLVDLLWMVIFPLIFLLG